MDSLAPSELPYQETLQSPLFLVTVEIPSPYEYPINLLATSTPPSHNPLKPMDAYELFHLYENIDDVNKILELLEPNKLLLWTWYYFQHCQQTMKKLEEEMWYQGNSAEDLLKELQILKIDEVLHPLVAEARWLDQRAMHFAWPTSNITIRLPACTPAPPTDMTTDYSTEQDTGGPSWPIIIVDDETTTPTPLSSSGPSYKKRTSNPTMNKQLHLEQATRNSESGIFGVKKGVMLRSHHFILSHGLLFHFNITYLVTCFLPHFHLS